MITASDFKWYRWFIRRAIQLWIRPKHNLGTKFSYKHLYNEPNFRKFWVSNWKHQRLTKTSRNDRGCCITFNISTELTMQRSQLQDVKISVCLIFVEYVLFQKRVYSFTSYKDAWCFHARHKNKSFCQNSLLLFVPNHSYCFNLYVFIRYASEVHTKHVYMVTKLWNLIA